MADQSNTDKLLHIVEALDPEKRQKEEQPPTDAELTEARAGLVEELKNLTTGDSPDIESARAVREAIDTIDSELTTRKETREATAAEAAKLLEGIETTEPPAPDGEGDGEGNGEGEDGAKDDDGKGAEDKAEDKQPAMVAGATLADAIRRSEQRKIEKVKEPAPADIIVAAVGPAQGRQLDGNATIDDVSSIFNRYAPNVKRGSAVLVHMEKMYPEERQLGLSVDENTRLVDAVTGPRAITAAGGICEPLPADFSNNICGDRGRPIANALPSFRADRGGIRFLPSVTVADLEPAITVWTSETDTTPGTDTKACPRVDCEDEAEARVDAIVACLTVGTFQARFSPEFWRSRLDLLMVAHDRVAEQTLYATIETGSTQVTYAGGSGTVVDVLQAIDKGTAGIRSRHRLLGTTMRAIVPDWIKAAFRAHVAEQAPAGSADLFALADAQLATFFSSRNITPIFSPDVDEFGAQGAGALVDFPGGNVDVVLFPEGTWLFLDGGTLDLGTEIRDSALNAVNDQQAFMETFEQVVQRGCESLSISVPVAETCICLPA